FVTGRSSRSKAGTSTTCSGNSLSQPKGSSSRRAPRRARPAGTRRGRRGGGAGLDARRALPAVVELLEHVEQRLVVHELVLEHERRSPRFRGGQPVERVAHALARAVAVVEHDARLRPTRLAAGGRARVTRVDAAREE